MSHRQKSHLLTAFGLCATLLLSGCSQFNVMEDYDSQANFKALKTYQWLPAQLTENDKIAQTSVEHPLTASRVRNAIEVSLNQKGLQSSPSRPSSYVSFHINSKNYMTPDPMTVQFGVGSYHRFGTGFLFETAPDYIESTRSDLVIQIYNNLGKVIWQSKASIALNMETTPKAKEAAIQALVDQMLKNFPP